MSATESATKHGRVLVSRAIQRPVAVSPPEAPVVVPVPVAVAVLAEVPVLVPVLVPVGVCWAQVTGKSMVFSVLVELTVK